MSTATYAQTLPLDTRVTESHLAALRRALAVPGEHRLYRAGKLPGLFPIRAGSCIDAALMALSENHLETVRTEAKGRQLTEWVRITPAGVAFVHKHDSPQAVLRELQATLGSTREGIPLWMHAATEEAARLQQQFTQQAMQMMERLDRLTERVDAALRRLDGETLPELFHTQWTDAVLAYLDQRRQAGATQPCSLRELFQVAQEYEEQLSLYLFHEGIRQCAERRALVLHPLMNDDAEYAILWRNAIFGSASR